MDKKTTFDRVCDIIRDNAGAGDVALTRETTMSDLGLDSLATVEVVVACEDEFDIQISQDAAPSTVGEFVDLVEEQLEK